MKLVLSHIIKVENMYLTGSQVSPIRLKSRTWFRFKILSMIDNTTK